MKRHLAWYCCLVALVLGLHTTKASAQVIFFEDFEGAVLGNSVNERIGTSIAERVATEPNTSAIPGVWSSTAPAGWTVDKAVDTYRGAPTVTVGVPGVGLADYGVDEWEGWNFARLDFWSTAAGDQDRSQFGTTSNASGTVAIADPDEYFDLGSQNDAVNGGYYSTALITPSFQVNGGTLHGVGFDSSWRPEAFDDSALGGTLVDLNNQSVEIVATFDNGTSVEVAAWDSDNSTNDPEFKDNAQDQHFDAGSGTLAFVAPADATSATLSFKIANAANDWWWAIDNVEVADITGGTGQKLFEDFEGVTLGDSVNERITAGSSLEAASDGTTSILGTEYPTTSRENAFTHTFPTGWSTDNAGTPGAGGGDDGFGVLEWEQWSIAEQGFWAEVGGSTRNGFTKATGNVAVADGDEWDDLGDPGDQGDLTTLMKTSPIDVSAEGIVTIDFDSSWRPEDSQEVTLIAYLDGSPTELLHWVSDSQDPNYHGTNVNEDVGFLLDTTGASMLELEFGYVGNDDWWWAIDNVRVQSGAIPSLVPEPSSIAMLGLLLGGLGIATRRRR
ncbi:PEP-CTERM sorting domain-containing protein [Aeoliella sp. ICT_H6.2]|uniref:PEP-CTERM sorting domain-containing protein n=1 Tax=Aeoliella straminimaris TaxID=2954799 RepID=A0A9X2FAG1_9BACT|nr:PEP-CTERM sorting domain-containing protein [Aeoliella straminimaris]MCO6042396.1 PEP-CTERM sorting domain-containing protein [Aeoliella straminimaris]